MFERLGAPSKNLDDGDIFTLPLPFPRCDACGLLILLHSHRCFSVWSDQNDGLVFYEALKPPPIDPYLGTDLLGVIFAPLETLRRPQKASTRPPRVPKITHVVVVTI